MEQEGLKILKAEVTNFKNIDHKVIEFEGKSAIVLGKNGAGKSSLIQAITCAVNSKMIPAKAIKKGEERASVSLKVGGVLNGEHQVYNIEMFFSEKDQKGRLVVSDEDGGKIPGAKSMVQSIVGNVGFDILEFIEMGLTKDGKVSTPGVREQIEILKQFLPIESQKELMNLDQEKKELYDLRTEINKEIKSNEAKLKDSQVDPEDIEKYSEKIDDSEVMKKMGDIGESISTYDRVLSGLSTKKLKKAAFEKRIEDLKSELMAADKELGEVSTEIDKGEKWLEGRERPSMEALMEEAEKIAAHNKKCEFVAACKKYDEDMKKGIADSNEITERLQRIENDKKKVFSDSPLPVKGLSFTEEEVLYKDLPFNENQHPSSTIIGVGLSIAMAMNPNLRLLIIKDGSLLDKKVLNHILKLVDKKGYQVFIEMVDFSGEKDVTVQFVEGPVE